MVDVDSPCNDNHGMTIAIRVTGPAISQGRASRPSCKATQLCSQPSLRSDTGQMLGIHAYRLGDASEHRLHGYAGCHSGTARGGAELCATTPPSTAGWAFPPSNRWCTPDQASNPWQACRVTPKLMSRVRHRQRRGHYYMPPRHITRKHLLEDYGSVVEAASRWMTT